MDNVSSRKPDVRPIAPSRSSLRHGRRLLSLLALLVGIAGSAWGIYVWQCNHSATEQNLSDTFVSAYLNTRPGVRYVGSKRCAECHDKESASYAHHPMGRSVSSADQWLPAQTDANPSFSAAGLRYVVERKDGKVRHREFVPADKGPPPAEVVAEIAFTIGSGRQGQSSVVNHAGRFYQSPISWYVRDKSWNLSPGYTKHHFHFNRTIPEACLFCHCNEAHVDPDTVNQYVPATLMPEPIGCERCHGPGELHVKARQPHDGRSGEDLTIVNPRRLSLALRDAVCQQCHLQGESSIVRAGKSLWDYRPGLPLEEFETVFVPPPERADSRKAVNHVVQMQQSRCFQASSGQMGCISCHDPHVLPPEKERVKWYRTRCLSCHEETSCRLTVEQRHKQNAADSCIDCHMPRNDSSNIAHASITDHRIVRRPRALLPDNTPVDFEFVPFHNHGDPAADASLRRDMGLSLAQQDQTARQAWSLLRPLISRATEDVAAREALGLALWRSKRSREALPVLEQVLQQAPRREVALHTAALAALEAGEVEKSIAYFQRLLQVNPYNWESRAFYAQALAFRRQWADAVEACRASLRLDPFETGPRMLMIDCLMHLGEKQRAQAEFDTLMALHPPNPDELRRWFKQQF